MTNLVQFPGLGLSFHLNRVAFTIGGVSIYWYGVCIAVGLCLALVFAFRHSLEFGVDPDSMVDVILIGVVLGIISARAYYVAMAPFKYESIWEMIAIRDGGLASCSAWHRRLYFAARMCRVDCWRLRVLGVWHATWQYGNACDRFVCDAAVLHCFQHAPIGRDVGHAILDRCRAGGGRLADQRVVCATPLIVRFCRIGRLLVCEEATCGVVAAQRSAGMAQRYVREVTGQDNALTHPR